MDSQFNTQESFRKEFDPVGYMNTYYNSSTGAFVGAKYMSFILTNLHKAFSSGDVMGDVLIDIGSGSTIYQIMSACESFKEIIASDLCEQNQQEYKAWLQNEPGAFDWSIIGKMVCELEGDREKWCEKEKKIREKVKHVLQCDILQNNPWSPADMPQADCLLSMLCFEAACKDFDTYRRALKNVSKVLKVGGHLVLGGVLGCRAWLAGDKTFTCLPLTEEFLRTALPECGYIFKQLEVQSVSEVCDKNTLNYYANFFLLAQKQKAI